jgi:regulator of cell morphogenesis and NO signaling
MKIENLSLGEIVTNKPQAAAIFENYNLDFCCRGKQKLSEAVNDPQKLTEIVDTLELLYAKTEHPSEFDFNSMDLCKLVDYILDIHHQYVKDIVPIIKQHLEKVATKHGETYPHMVKIRKLFNIVSGELIGHMMKEELILFPRIKSMQSAYDEGDAVLHISVENPIRVMEKEHETAGDLMAEIKSLCNNYTPPENACMTHRVCLEELKMFEMDLHKHVHLENNILFPKSIALEHNINKNII